MAATDRANHATFLMASPPGASRSTAALVTMMVARSGIQIKAYDVT